MANNVSPLIAIGQLIDQSWETYHTHFKSLMRISMWFFLPAFLYIVSDIISPLSQTLGNASALTGSALVRTIVGGGLNLLTGVIVMPIVGAWIFLAVTKTLRAIHQQKEPVEKEIVQEARKDLVPYILQIILLFFVSISALLPMLPGLLLIGINIFTEGGRVLGVFGILFMLLGTLAAALISIYLTVSLSFSGYTLSLDKKRPLDGIKASHNLVKGRFFPTLWRIIAPAIVFGVIPFVIQLGATVLTVLVVASLPETNDSIVIQGVNMLGTIILLGLTALVTPLMTTSNFFLYESLKRTRDGSNA